MHQYTLISVLAAASGALNLAQTEENLLQVLMLLDVPRFLKPFQVAELTHAGEHTRIVIAEFVSIQQGLHAGEVGDSYDTGFLLARGAATRSDAARTALA